jgi:transaldolase
MDLPKTPADEATFRKTHEADKMAKEKLDEGIQGFSKAIVALEKLLEERYDAMGGKKKVGQAAHDFFKVYDLDGDGFITREEWGGAANVFAALDTDGDGRISPTELGAGLGGAFVLAK